LATASAQVCVPLGHSSLYFVIAVMIVVSEQINR